MDIVDNETRSQMMSSIKAKNTRPEIKFRKYLHAQGFRYRLHVSDLPGTPDIVLPKYKLCIFVHGCFWHQHKGCKFAYKPKSHVDFWQKKLSGNKVRDVEVKIKLRHLGWRVFEIWECGIKNLNPDEMKWLNKCIKSDMPMLSWPDYDV